MAMATAALVLAASLAAQPAPEEIPVESVVVVAAPNAETVEERAYEHVRELVAPTRAGKLGRWNQPICVKVTGGLDPHNDYVAGKIRKAASEAGAKLGKKGCRANLFVLLTADSRSDLAKLNAENPGFFLTKQEGGGCDGDGSRITSGGASTLTQFIETPRPVRWWHSAQSNPANDQPWSGCTLRVPYPTRLSHPMREDFVRVFVVADLRLADGVKLASLADYVAMVSLAQIAPDADGAGVPTVLSLFSDRDAGRSTPGVLTRWDKAFLKGLYAAREDLADESAQRREIARALKEATVEAELPPE